VPTYPLFQQYPPYELALASKMVDVVLHEKLDILHVHYAIPHASAAYTAKKILETKNIKIPIVTTLHGTDITLVGKDASFEPVVTFSINESDVVTTVSESLKRDTYAHFPITKDIKVIPNFIDLDRFKKQEKNHFKKAVCPNDEKLLVHISNFRKVKRMNDVVSTFDLVRKQIPSKLLLIGDGPERINIEIQCRELGIAEDVRLLGKLDAVEEVLSIADLFLMPSESESFGLSALEAMACEVPVISSNAGGIPELNIDGVTGFISDVGNVTEMAKNALFILRDENLSQFRANALARAKQFDFHAIVPEYEKMYQLAYNGANSL
jgi:N-acetyl-alpha-D-glucosaminyl L-malate synthase BshA